MFPDASLKKRIGGVGGIQDGRMEIQTQLWFLFVASYRIC